MEKLFEDRYFVSGRGIGSSSGIAKWFKDPALDKSKVPKPYLYKLELVRYHFRKLLLLLLAKDTKLWAHWKYENNSKKAIIDNFDKV